MFCMQRFFHSEELSLLLSSYLSLHACRCLKGLKKHAFASEHMPRLRRALWWRLELRRLFTVFEVVLSVASEPLSLQDVRESVATFTGSELQEERVGQILSLANGMLDTCELSGGAAGIVQHCEDPGSLPERILAVLLARLERFESSLACLTDEFAQDVVPTCVLAPRPRSGRRLVRQHSVTIPKEGLEAMSYRELDERTKNLQCALRAMKDCEKWQSIVRGAVCAGSIMEQLFTKDDAVPLGRVIKALTAERSNVRSGRALPMPLVPASLLLLMDRTLGGLSVTAPAKPKRSVQCFFQCFGGSSLAATKQALQWEHNAMQRRQQQFSTRAKRAFIETIPGSSSQAENHMTVTADKSAQKRLRRTDSTTQAALRFLTT